MDNQPDCLELGLAPRIAATSVLEREREWVCVCVCVCVERGGAYLSSMHFRAAPLYLGPLHLTFALWN